MNILFLGDIIGRSGRTVIEAHLPDLRRKHSIDFVIANGENAAAGFGITEKIAKQLFDAGVDVITGGNHTFDQKDILPVLNNEKRIMRPANYPAGTPGHGANVFETGKGEKILVINLMGRVFMNPLDCPFKMADTILSKYRLGSSVNAVVVDFHGEATSEKMAMGHYLDGRASLVVGTHSHVPTADTQILNGGTAYQTDAGMCGDYDSVIGMEKDEPVQRFLSRINKDRFNPAKGPATLCGVMVQTKRTGLADTVSPLRIGPRLINT